MLEEKKQPQKEEKAQIEPKKVKLSRHTVLKQFTLDKVYNAGATIELADGEIKTKLLTNKFIANGISRSN